MVTTIYCCFYEEYLRINVILNDPFNDPSVANQKQYFVKASFISLSFHLDNFRETVSFGAEIEINNGTLKRKQRYITQTTPTCQRQINVNH